MMGVRKEAQFTLPQCPRVAQRDKRKRREAPSRNHVYTSSNCTRQKIQPDMFASIVPILLNWHKSSMREVSSDYGLRVVDKKALDMGKLACL